MIEGTGRVSKAPTPTPTPAPPPVDQRAAMYQQIAENHARLVMVLQRCGVGKKIKGLSGPQQLQLGLSFFVHLEHSIHFLAGEILEIKAFLRQQCEDKAEGSGDGVDPNSQEA